MPTVEQAIRSAYARADLEPNPEAGLVFFNERLEELYAKARFRAVRKVGHLVIPGTVSTGLATTTRGSAVVLGDTDAQAVWTTALVGRFIRLSINWYEIVEVAGGSLRLATPFTESAVTAGAYRIVDRYPRLAADVRMLGTIYNPRLQRPLDIRPMQELDLLAPERPWSAGSAELVAELGEFDDGQKKFEFYPYSDEDELYPYTYWTRPPVLDLKSPLPGFLDVSVMRQGLLVDIYTQAGARWANQGKIEQAGYFLNAASRAETAWGKKIDEAITSDRGVDDLVLLIGNDRTYGREVGDVRTAYDEWMHRGGSLT